MQIKRRAITVGMTFFLAAATGHVMQNGDTISARLRGVDPAPAPVLASVETTAAIITPAVAPASKPDAAPEATVLQANATGEPDAAAPGAPAADTHLPPLKVLSGLPNFPAVQPTPLASGVQLAERIETLDTGAVSTESAADQNYTVFGIACADPSITLEPMARAMLKMTLSAPCFANERVTITHEGLVFAMTTDKAGELVVVVPALAPTARMDVRFASGDSISASEPVSGLDGLNRVAVVWRGAEGLQLGAYENGATFGGAGHVSAGQPRARGPDAGARLVTLGDAPLDHTLMAQVYPAPPPTLLDHSPAAAAATT